jgi:hypothetical protein
MAITICRIGGTALSYRNIILRAEKPTEDIKWRLFLMNMKGISECPVEVGRRVGDSVLIKKDRRSTRISTKQLKIEKNGVSVPGWIIEEWVR